jgi:NAD(P)-dependent dehydrogenase (short-subunit alcohol dehydrogenase family)
MAEAMQDVPMLDRQAVAALAPGAQFSLQGRVAAITGAAGGLGRWLCAGFGAAGASVLAVDIDAARTAELGATLGSLGLDVRTMVADLLEDDAPERIVDRAVNELGRLDVVVNNAGLNERMPILEVDRPTYDRMMAVDLRAPYFLARAAVLPMIDQGGGAIINIGSINASVGLEHVSVLGSAKAALTQLTKVMAVEWTRFGVRANCLAPGFLDTAMNVGVWQDDARRRWVLERVPMRRPGEPRELVGACLLLASDAGSFMTGQTLYVDGGFLAGSRWSDA